MHFSENTLFFPLLKAEHFKVILFAAWFYYKMNLILLQSKFTLLSIASTFILLCLSSTSRTALFDLGLFFFSWILLLIFHTILNTILHNIWLWNLKPTLYLKLLFFNFPGSWKISLFIFEHQKSFLWLFLPETM